jgi:hypothetical protein
MLLAIAIPVGVTFGAVTWAVLRGRGKLTGLVLCALSATFGAFIGGLASQAMSNGSGRTELGVGVAVGALLASLAGAVAFGRRPKRAGGPVDRAGVAIEQPEHGEAPRTVR